MAFRIGLVGLCTSHPGAWVPIIRKLTEEGHVDVEITACWDSGETRPEDFAEEFAQQAGIPAHPSRLEEMVDHVDGVIVHTTNWDRHIEHATIFIEAGKSVLLDKPVIGNMHDANQVLDWCKQGHRITGGSSLRFAYEVQEYRVKCSESGNEPYAAFGGCGTDEYNYGIHAYSLMCGLMGGGLDSVTYLGESAQKQLRMRWKDGRIAFLSVGGKGRLPFHVTAVSADGVDHIQVQTGRIYRALLEASLPYLTGISDTPPCPIEELLEAEMGAIAARNSWQTGGREIFLTDLRDGDPGYDGTQFAREYRRQRLG